MLSAVLAALTAMASPLVDGFKRYQERKQAEHKVYIAREDARVKIAQQTIKAELELGTQQIKATNPWFKHFTFFMWFGPFIITTILPEYGARIFENWKVMPEWYAQSCVAIMFCVWGVQVGKEYISNIFARAGQFFRRRQRLVFNRKVFYDTLRSSSGPIGQHEVKALEKALDAIEKAEEK